MRVFLLWIVCGLVLIGSLDIVAPVAPATDPAVSSPARPDSPQSQTNIPHDLFDIPSLVSYIVDADGERQRKQTVAPMHASLLTLQTQWRSARWYAATHQLFPLIPFSVLRIFLPRSAPDEPFPANV